MNKTSGPAKSKKGYKEYLDRLLAHKYVQPVEGKFLSGWRIILLAMLALIAIGCGALYYHVSKRNEQMDADIQRVNSLQELSVKIAQYYKDKHHLPERLSDLEEDANPIFTRDSFFFDPESRQPYKYTVVAPTKYSLCVNFDFDSAVVNERIPYGISQNTQWAHGVGRSCYDLSVTPSLGRKTP